METEGERKIKRVSCPGLWYHHNLSGTFLVSITINYRYGNILCHFFFVFTFSCNNSHLVYTVYWNFLLIENSENVSNTNISGHIIHNKASNYNNKHRTSPLLMPFRHGYHTPSSSFKEAESGLFLSFKNTA